jgi:ADP-L-glycero-D-manno-heptose 6-epimerase
LWFFDHPEKSGIFNLGTGRAQPFNDVAQTVINSCLTSKLANELMVKYANKSEDETITASNYIDYVPFPEALRGKYQCYTQADLTKLRAAGCNHVFADVNTGVERYIRHLIDHS